MKSQEGHSASLKTLLEWHSADCNYCHKSKYPQLQSLHGPCLQTPALLPVASLYQPRAELYTCQDMQKDILQDREAEEHPWRQWQPRAVAADPWEVPGRASPCKEQEKWGFALCSITFSPIPGFPARVPGTGGLETVQNKIKRSLPLDLRLPDCYWGLCSSFPSPPLCVGSCYICYLSSPRDSWNYKITVQIQLEIIVIIIKKEGPALVCFNYG